MSNKLYVECLREECVHNYQNECLCAMIVIGEDGVCEEYKEDKDVCCEG